MRDCEKDGGWQLRGMALRLCAKGGSDWEECSWLREEKGEGFRWLAKEAMGSHIMQRQVQNQCGRISRRYGQPLGATDWGNC